MDILTISSQIDFAQIITMTIVHSIWQSSVIALIMFMMIRAMNQKSAKTKYNIAALALFMTVMMSFFTAIYYGGKSILSSSSSHLDISQSNQPLSLSSLDIIETQLQSNIWEMISVYDDRIMITWMLGMILFLSRFLLGHIGIYHVKRSIDYNVPSWLLDTLNSSMETLKLDQSIKMGLSNNIDTPMVIGFIKPIILFPIASVNFLSVKEVEAIIIHELGHIIRNDYLHNQIMVIIESIFFYNPAIWWMCKLLREERENACDEIVLAQGYDSLSYAKTLLHLQEHSTQAKSPLAISLLSNKTTLMNRIKRILNQPVKLSYIKERSLAIIFIFIGLIGLTSAKIMSSHDLELEPLAKINLSPLTQPAITVDEPQSTDIVVTKRAMAPIMKKTVIDTIPTSSDRERALEKMEQVIEKMEEKSEKILSKHYEKWEQIGEDIEHKHAKEIERLEEKLELRSKNLETEWEDMDWEKYGEELGEKFENAISEEWLEEMTEMGERLEEELSGMTEDIEAAFNEEWSEKLIEMSETIGEVITEAYNEELVELSNIIEEELVEELEELEEEIDIKIKNGEDQLKSQLAEELINDGYWERGKNNSFKITNTSMTVNGKSIDPMNHTKYMDLIKQSMPHAFEGKSRIVYKLKGNNKSSFSASINH